MMFSSESASEGNSNTTTIQLSEQALCRLLYTGILGNVIQVSPPFTWHAGPYPRGQGETTVPSVCVINYLRLRENMLHWSN